MLYNYTLHSTTALCNYTLHSTLCTLHSTTTQHYCTVLHCITGLNPYLRHFLNVDILEGTKAIRNTCTHFGTVDWPSSLSIVKILIANLRLVELCSPIYFLKAYFTLHDFSLFKFYANFLHPRNCRTIWSSC